jgi:hypothetical protein
MQNDLPHPPKTQPASNRRFFAQPTRARMAAPRFAPGPCVLVDDDGGMLSVASTWRDRLSQGTHGTQSLPLSVASEGTQHPAASVDAEVSGVGHAGGAGAGRAPPPPCR